MTRFADTLPALRDLTIGVAITALAACAFAQDNVQDPPVKTDEATSADTDASYTSPEATTDSYGTVTPDSSVITKDPASDVAGEVELYDDSLSDEALTATDPFAEDPSDEMEEDSDDGSMWDMDATDEPSDDPEG